MNIDLMFKGEHIAAREFDGKTPTLTIVRVEPIEIDDDGKRQTRPLVHFKDQTRTWLVNVTNKQLLVGMWGKETDNYIGKRITLGAAPTRMKGEPTLGIRVIGSPDLQAPVKVEVKLPKKRPVEVTLVPTGQRQQERGPARERTE